MSIDISELGFHKMSTPDNSVIILPQDFLKESTDGYKYSSETLSFYKYANKTIEINYMTEPELLIVQQSGEWFGPILLLTSDLLARNPAIVSVICGLIANYIYDIFKTVNKPKVNLKVIYQETESSKLTEIHYEGSIEGIKDIESAVLEIAKKS